MFNYLKYFKVFKRLFMKINEKKINLILILSAFCTLVIVIIIIASITMILKTNILGKVNKKLGISKKYAEEKVVEIDKKWSEKLLSGGYILHFRHAERDKWIDVQMYDALESDVHDNGINKSRMAENDYFGDAVCLNERGLIQAKAMGELLKWINLPIGFVISSPSCRARQTADFAFDGYDQLNRILVHEGPYLEKKHDRINKLKDFYLKLPIEKNKNTIVSSHNSVIKKEIFDEVNLSEVDKRFKLEEGGFYIISNDNNRLVLEYKFHNFKNFTKNFFPR